MKKLKERWNVQSNFQLIVIFIVFSVTGSTSLFVAGPVLHFFSINREAFPEAFYGAIFYYTLRILIIFPIYQVLLVITGAIFGQFKFFWTFEKKMLCRLGFKNLCE